MRVLAINFEPMVFHERDARGNSVLEALLDIVEGRSWGAGEVAARTAQMRLV